jgi:hypothetical protein
MKKPHTDKQGQYLAFIYYYGKIHRRTGAHLRSPICNTTSKSPRLPYTK